jgi:hypothetical protein
MKKCKTATPLIVMLCLGYFGACTEQSPRGQNASNRLDSTTRAMQQEITELESSVRYLKSTIARLTSNEQAALISTESEDYGLARTNFGMFTVKCKNVTPFLDGYKVKLEIGNLTSATFHGAKLTVNWFPDVIDTSDVLGNWHGKDFDVLTLLQVGRWNEVEVTLTPATPLQIKNLSVLLKLDQVSFSR